MKISLSYSAVDGNNPFTARNNQAASGTPSSGVRTRLNQSIEKIKAAYNGTGVWSNGIARPKIQVGTTPAAALVTPTGVQSGDTVTVNGQALTATQQRALGSFAFDTVIATDVIVVNGHTFTAVASGAVANEFNVGADDTETATNAAAAVNTAAALVANTLLYGIVAARSTTTTVYIYGASAPLTAAQATAQNAITISSPDATITASAATLENGAAAANNQFDYIGTNITTAASLIYAIENSTTALVSDHANGTNRSAIVTLSSVAVGDTVTLAGEVLTAGTTATDTGGARIATAPPNFWCQASTDTNDAVSLVNCINSHPRLGQLFRATNSSGVVTIRERNPGLGKECTVQTSNGSRLAVTGTVSNSGGLFSEVAGALIQARIPGAPGNAVTIATSNGTRLPIEGSVARLAGGASSTFTF